MNELVDGWSEEQALDLLAQGYSVEQVARRTGCTAAWLRAQRVPTTTALTRLRQATSMGREFKG